MEANVALIVYQSISSNGIDNINAVIENIENSSAVSLNEDQYCTMALEQQPLKKMHRS